MGTPATVKPATMLEADLDSQPTELEEQRTFIRRRSDPALAGRLRGEIGRFEGEWVEVERRSGSDRRTP